MYTRQDMIMSDFFPWRPAVATLKAQYSEQGDKSDDPPGEFVLPIFILFYIRSEEQSAGYRTASQAS